jgi:hypothetical protein
MGFLHYLCHTTGMQGFFFFDIILCIYHFSSAQITFIYLPNFAFRHLHIPQFDNYVICLCEVFISCIFFNMLRGVLYTSIILSLYIISKPKSLLTHWTANKDNRLKYCYLKSKTEQALYCIFLMYLKR